MRSILSLPFTFGIALGLACGGADDDGATGDATGDASACEHGTSVPCACSNGRMGEQMCKHDGTGFEPCVCDEPAGETTGSSSPDGTSESSGGGDVGGTQGDSGDGSGTTIAADTSTGGSDTGVVGTAPEAAILHPSDGEERVVDVAIPFIGEATDLEDGALSGAALSWWSDVDGPIGQGEMFEASLSTLGDHVVTLTVTDADGNVAEATITLSIVAP